MVLTGLIRAVKPNTKAFKQNNLKSAQLLSLEGAQTGEKTKDDKCQVPRVQTKETKLVFCLTAIIKPVGTIKCINRVQIPKKVSYWIGLNWDEIATSDFSGTFVFFMAGLGQKSIVPCNRPSGQLWYSYTRDELQASIVLFSAPTQTAYKLVKTGSAK